MFATNSALEKYIISKICQPQHRKKLKKLKHAKAYCFLLLSLLAIASGCTSTSTAIQASFIKSEEFTEMEKVRLPNCNNSTIIEQSFLSSQITNWQGSAELGLSAEVVSAKIATQRGGSLQTQTQLLLRAAGNTDMEYKLNKIYEKQDWQITVPGKQDVGIFTIVTPKKIAYAESPKDLGCKTVSPVPPLTPPLVTAKPEAVNLSRGESFTPIPDWKWVCSGDFRLRRADRTSRVLYNAADSRLAVILVLEQDSKFTLQTPFGGYCEAVAETEEQIGIQKRVERIWLEKYCSLPCTKINVKKLTIDGYVKDEYFIYRQRSS